MLSSNLQLGRWRDISSCDETIRLSNASTKTSQGALCHFSCEWVQPISHSADRNKPSFFDAFFWVATRKSINEAKSVNVSRNQQWKVLQGKWETAPRRSHSTWPLFSPLLAVSVQIPCCPRMYIGTRFERALRAAEGPWLGQEIHQMYLHDTPCINHPSVTVKARPGCSRRLRLFLAENRTSASSHSVAVHQENTSVPTGSRDVQPVCSTTSGREGWDFSGETARSLTENPTLQFWGVPTYSDSWSTFAANSSCFGCILESPGETVNPPPLQPHLTPITPGLSKGGVPARSPQPQVDSKRAASVENHRSRRRKWKKRNRTKKTTLSERQAAAVKGPPPHQVITDLP